MRNVLIGAALLVTGCAQPVPPYVPTSTPISQRVAPMPTATRSVPVRTQPGRTPRGSPIDAQIQAAAETVAREAMRDPTATQFRNVRVVPYAGREGYSIVCGELNGKNAYGGYVGFKAFLMTVQRASPTEIKVSEPVIIPNQYPQPERNLIRQHCGEAGL